MTAIGQESDSMPVYYHKPIEVVDSNFIKDYNYLRPKVIKVYPYAMYAADMLDKIENDLSSIKRRRARHKFCKISYKSLKEDFKYAMVDLYRSEGRVLMKLIGRETGMTVFEIVSKYRGRKDAMMFNMMGKMFEQDIKAKYIKDKEYVLEYIIREIQDGKISLADPKLITKAEYKIQEEKRKSIRKANKKKAKALKKKLRKEKRLKSKKK